MDPSGSNTLTPAPATPPGGTRGGRGGGRGSRGPRGGRGTARGAFASTRGGQSSRAGTAVARTPSATPTRADASYSDGSSSDESQSTAKPRKRRRRSSIPVPPEPQGPWAAARDTDRRFLSNDLGLLQSGAFSDATVMCIKKEWKVHKTILCTRSPWFAAHIEKHTGENGELKPILLHDYPEAHVETLLNFIYSGTLDMTKYALDQGSFVIYTELYNLGRKFGIDSLQSDALTLLGRYCDTKLRRLCTYDPSKSGRSGVVDEDAADPGGYMHDLLEAIWKAYDGITPTNQSNGLQSLLATFVYAGRHTLLSHEGFRRLSLECPRFGNDVFKLMLGETVSEYSPGDAHDAVRRVGTGVDHSHRSQAPDRCAHCAEVFDGDKNKRAMWNPFEGAWRPATFCWECVRGNEEGGAPLWRIPAKGATRKE
ncbi:hypothetical protein QBC47DRAFT_430607 [Echria macrotheca]|uniref:BTB domain-containing protein n=1 Tax=Echria macrotheca TaxID=438768 RepID=A0AAJ0FA15_9PEZI|nr:hypothetical protein QBC47DRAFT_430607 [Echria macrotheca]